jgi:hypothetical protein
MANSPFRRLSRRRVEAAVAERCALIANRHASLPEAAGADGAHIGAAILAAFAANEAPGDGSRAAQ